MTTTKRFEIDYMVTEGSKRIPFIWDFSTETEDGCYVSYLTLDALRDTLEEFNGVEDFNFLNKNQTLLESLYKKGDVRWTLS